MASAAPDLRNRAHVEVPLRSQADAERVGRLALEEGHRQNLPSAERQIDQALRVVERRAACVEHSVIEIERGDAVSGEELHAIENQTRESDPSEPETVEDLSRESGR